MFYGSETWLVEDDGDVKRLKHTEKTQKRMVRWMCNVNVRDGQTSE